MKALIAITDREWFEFLSRLRPDEVNFWQPSGSTQFRALKPGQPLLFKLHAPDDRIVGGGFFAHFSLLPVSLAWQAFGQKNGARSYDEMRARIERYRRTGPEPREDYTIGSIILVDPFFLAPAHWIAVPTDFARNVVRYKGYALDTEPGRTVWRQVIEARGASEHRVAESWGSTYGDPALVKRRLGQGAFRITVADAYNRHCAVTRERTLVVLDAAHIRPVSANGQHRVDNGLLLRSDVHTLFDRGYVTVTPDYRFRVSRRLREDWSNGRIYYELAGRDIALPTAPDEWPSRTELEWHADTVFLG
jgi:putative restriction endonuclease